MGPGAWIAGQGGVGPLGGPGVSDSSSSGGPPARGGAGASAVAAGGSASSSIAPPAPVIAAPSIAAAAAPGLPALGAHAAGSAPRPPRDHLLIGEARDPSWHCHCIGLRPSAHWGAPRGNRPRLPGDLQRGGSSAGHAGLHQVRAGHRGGDGRRRPPAMRCGLGVGRPVGAQRDGGGARGRPAASLFVLFNYEKLYVSVVPQAVRAAWVSIWGVHGMCGAPNYV